MSTLLQAAGGLTTVKWSEPHSSRGPRRWRWLLAPLVLLPIGLGAAWLLGPQKLEDTALTGARGPECVRLVIAADVSGSMANLAVPRDRAIEQLLAWVPANLRRDDEIAVINFAQTATVVIPPTPIGTTTSRAHAAVTADSTELTPLMTQLSSLEPTRCQTSLLMMGDGQFADLPPDETQGRAQLAAAGIDTMTLLVPGRTDTPQNWSQLYPYAPPTTFDGTNPDATALTIGRHVATLTTQDLSREPHE